MNVRHKGCEGTHEAMLSPCGTTICWTRNWRIPEVDALAKGVMAPDDDMTVIVISGALIGMLSESTARTPVRSSTPMLVLSI